MTKTYTPNHTIQSAPYMVFVHEEFEQYGEKWAVVNKGNKKTACTFKVPMKMLS